MDDLLLTPEGNKELMKIKSENNEKKEGFNSNNEESFAGCTANVALIVDNDLYVANAGDSRSVISENNIAIEMSIDHKPEDEIERNRITKAGGSIYDGRVNGNLNLSRAIGDFEYKRQEKLNYDEQLIICKPDIKKYVINKDTSYLIMGCDGIWECLNNQEVVNYISGNNGEGEVDIVEKLLDTILAKDNSGKIKLFNFYIFLIELNFIYFEKE